MRKLSADYIFPVSSPPLKQGILILDDDGTLLEIIDTGGKLRESANLEYYNGILIPGFINCHLHLDLSWLRGTMPMHTRLPRFIENMIRIRRNPSPSARNKAAEADRDMSLSGTVAAADITTSDELFPLKTESRILYINLVEVLDAGLNPDIALNQANALLESALAMGLPAFLSPHAPYTVSPALLKRLREMNESRTSVFSIHNQEAGDENEMFRGRENALTGMLMKHGLPVNPLATPAASSLQALEPLFPVNANILLVHNTHSSREDIEKTMRAHPSLYWVLCPGSNLYIEGALPPVDILRACGATIALGTDSYASNTSLSILEEMKTISAFFPSIPLPELVQWATLNGARALNLHKSLGSFDPGKKPGVQLLEHCNLASLELTGLSRSRVLV